MGQLQTIYRVSDFLTDEEILEAWELWKCCEMTTQITRLCDEFVRPRIDVISEKVGQPCDARYVTYVLCYFFSQAKARVT